MTAPSHPDARQCRRDHFVFPTVYPLKVAGKNDVALESTVVEIVRRHVNDFDETTVTVRESKAASTSLSR